MEDTDRSHINGTLSLLCYIGRKNWAIVQTTLPGMAQAVHVCDCTTRN